MPEEEVLICKPVDSNYVIPGTLPGKCSQCDQSVSIAPSSWLLLHDRPGMKILCVRCAVARIKANEHAEIEALTPAQRGEIEEYLEEGI